MKLNVVCFSFTLHFIKPYLKKLGIYIQRKPFKFSMH